MAQVWWEEARPEDAPVELGEALEAAGLRRASGERSGAGVLIVSGELPHDCALLARLSNRGRERVLAVIPPGLELETTAPWRYLAWGASDVIGWSSSATCAEVQARLDRWAQIDSLVGSPLIQSNLVGQSTAWLIAVRNVVEFARFASSPVLILGESGTGKELAARVIHALDPRPEKRDLVVLDCSTIVPELSGSEFYGHERGAFTGATGVRQGAFELAHQGTLFLDEVGELPVPLQAQLLRVIQERTYKRVGGTGWQQTDFRLVCATNRDLAAEVSAGRFRQDLFHRITSAICYLPPLRDRPEDILPLARHFLEASRPGTRVPELDPAVRALLQSRPYPGNVRELRQVMTRIASRHVGEGPITPGDVPPSDRPPPDPAAPEPDGLADAVRRAISRGAGLKDIGREATEAAIRVVVEEEGGNLQRAARRLGVTDRALQLRRRSGLPPD